MHTCMHAHAYTYMHTYIRTYKNMYIRTCMHANLHAYIHGLMKPVLVQNPRIPATGIPEKANALRPAAESPGGPEG